MDKYIFTYLILILVLFGCEQNIQIQEPQKKYEVSENILDYIGVPKTPRDRSMLMFSDLGAWFAYGLQDATDNGIGFSGPFLMTQENGVWASQGLGNLQLSINGNKVLGWKNALVTQKSFTGQLEQVFADSLLGIWQQLVFKSGHTAIQRSVVTNRSKAPVTLKAHFLGTLFDLDLHISKEEDRLKLVSGKSDAVGYIQFLNKPMDISVENESSFNASSEQFTLEPGDSKSFLVSQTFIFPEYSWEEEKREISQVDFDTLLKFRQREKERELSALGKNLKDNFRDSVYEQLVSKAHLTLQNNWRIPAGELKHQGLFPSYHYEWFHGFWSWDSWKHAVGLSLYNPELAKDQMRAMFDFQRENGFIVDCVYRDTTIEAHNYRDTKPPLSAWAVAKIMEKDSDTSFVKEMYPKLVKYHNWWYADRDHDQDGLCEYGSTDGTLIAAKWESGMDNAIRFDDSKILKNSENAFSLDQESVDLNAYLYAEKLHLATLAEVLENNKEAKMWKDEAAILKERIQQQFFDDDDGWFYDTNLKGDTFIKGAGSEGWIPLWAKAATQQQAEAVKAQMMDPKKFYVKVPFQTMAADHPKFNPLKGYWRGPNWLDQAYFGIKGLRNYGFGQEADEATVKLLNGAEGLLDKGSPIYENYHPLTGKGLNAPNFSWSAAHLLMMLTSDE
ncbi:MGH1-like glycoside hydrolase domain-containing protein [Flagellimonas meishanensis]|uniref:MGH1-like glycoside hydrolase domain-containing protein n=1 Tax=Flagellimonas meishanensis TaxID=2873264 RepID=UPI001CA63E70|nr:trehalase family glycosidase [[Muricauda] meishanensis]